MIQNILIALRFLGDPVGSDRAGQGMNPGSAPWLNDPLAHPRLARMSLIEIADLPFAELRPCGRE